MSKETTIDIPNLTDDELQHWHEWALDRLNTFEPPITKMVEELEHEYRKRQGMEDA